MIDFETLWENHPTIYGDSKPCNKDVFANQCAIGLGNALARSGFNLSLLPKIDYCWHHPKSEGHILRAEKLADALNTVSIPGFHRREEIPVKNWNNYIAGKKGIIFFKDYWVRNTDRPGRHTGDHIDLWNGTRMTDWTSWVRVRFGVSVEGYWSDFKKSSKIYFWRAK